MEASVNLTWSMVMWVSLLFIACSTAVNNTCDFTKGGVWTCNYIPLNIPDGVEKVHIKLSMHETPVFEVNHTYFVSENWRRVKYFDLLQPVFTGAIFIFKDETFRNLKELNELHLHIRNNIILESYSLSGLTNVRILDFSQCHYLRINYIMGALNGSDKVPNLEQLILSQVSYYGQSLRIDTEFSKCLKQKPVSYIDVSGTHIEVLELQTIKDLGELKKLNFSRATINYINHTNTSPIDLQHLQVVDYSYFIFSELALPVDKTVSISNVNFPMEDRGQHISLLLAPEVVNITGVNVRFAKISLYNIKLLSTDSVIKTRTRELILMHNSLRRFDVELTCENLDLNSIERLNLANNGLEYIHPSIFGCIPNLANLDLSNNELHMMFMENLQLFGKLLKGSTYVKTVSLAFNGLIDLPEDFFGNNTLLEIINLEGNKLTEVHFSLRHLLNLQLLNLASNSIKTLDEASMQCLDALGAALKLGKTSYNTVFELTSTTTVDVNIKARHLLCNIHGNPLMCDKCDKKAFINWLSDVDYIDTLSDNVTCKSDHGDLLQVNKDALTIVQYVCDRNTRNNILIIISVLVSVGGISVVVFLYIRRRRIRKENRRNEVINDLRNVEDRFAVFLSYSRDDINFVEENVVAPLNEGLQRIIGTDRNLVCQGDLEFRLGRYIHNESLRCIEQTEVFLCVISNSYCNSNYCDTEFNQAIELKKPVLLMMKDEFDVDLMSPAMQLLFRNNVRVLWECDNGQYRLKTSWQNLCESIVGLATN